MAAPLEIELLITAWDNAKKNVFGGDGMNIDPETGEIIDTSVEMSPDLADLVTDIDDKMMDLVSHYRRDAAMQVNAEFAAYTDETFIDIRETAGEF